MYRKTYHLTLFLTLGSSYCFLVVPSFVLCTLTPQSYHLYLTP